MILLFAVGFNIATALSRDNEMNTVKPLNPTNVHQIMFSPIGTYATSTATLHVKIVLDIQAFDSAINNYIKLLQYNIKTHSQHNSTMALKSIIAQTT